MCLDKEGVLDHLQRMVADHKADQAMRASGAELQCVEDDAPTPYTPFAVYRRNQMPNLDHEIETLRQQAAQRAITIFYRAVNSLSVYDVRVFDVFQMFIQDAWEMRGLTPRWAGSPG
jgi:hypothetical protein